MAKKEGRKQIYMRIDPVQNPELALYVKRMRKKIPNQKFFNDVILAICQNSTPEQLAIIERKHNPKCKC
jgi:hypothetical protein